ncbi:2-aminoethylphosphonate--pyruvate transaminase [Zoogloea sp.]|uniref:2-aminoethylphosphonate--pyruvate transaminase n=1 Tax=Zoogloea sp. TaxID=49181 RepID=UPI001AC753E1|nr:2-aminoethylphosphonate--pyruvate transaminase [Zoogloea sp.]MBN8285623.1 2-aminoethylphosphonate--pyruvate transaminase [Zoogloea sp.]
MPEPILLTPGPLTTTRRTKEAMLQDWGSWDQDFNALTAGVCARLTDIVGGADSHVCVPLQGSGTFAVEAALGTLVPVDGKVLVPNNGAYCQRVVRILNTLGRSCVVLPFGEDEPADPVRIARALADDPTITHVAQVHCETGTGILNPLPAIAEAVASQGRSLIVDAMSTFGLIPIDAARMPFDAVIAASGKCLEGVPGMGFVIARRVALEEAAGRCHSLALDLHDQWRYMQRTGQWRFTPPTHVLAALHEALDQYREEGGPPARLGRYARNCQALVAGMRALGLRTFLEDRFQAPVIVTFHAPTDPAYCFEELYARVKARGFILYPGKLTRVDTFRVGCIGAIDTRQIHAAVAAVGEALADMGVRHPANASGEAHP